MTLTLPNVWRCQAPQLQEGNLTTMLNLTGGQRTQVRASRNARIIKHTAIRCGHSCSASLLLNYLSFFVQSETARYEVGEIRGNPACMPEIWFISRWIGHASLTIKCTPLAVPAAPENVGLQRHHRIALKCLLAVEVLKGDPRSGEDVKPRMRVAWHWSRFACKHKHTDCGAWLHRNTR